MKEVEDRVKKYKKILDDLKIGKVVMNPSKSIYLITGIELESGNISMIDRKGWTWYSKISNFESGRLIFINMSLEDFVRTFDNGAMHILKNTLDTLPVRIACFERLKWLKQRESKLLLICTKF